jgi:hypothetical protein
MTIPLFQKEAWGEVQLTRTNMLMKVNWISTYLWNIPNIVDYSIPMAVKTKRIKEPLIISATRRQKDIKDLTKREGEEGRRSSQSKREIEYSIKQLEVDVLINTLIDVILNTNKINTRFHLLSKKDPEIATKNSH